MTLQSENGLVGMGPAPEPGKEDKDYVNAGGAYITAYPGAYACSSADSFLIIRGGHVDCTFLGAMQVDEKGNHKIMKECNLPLTAAHQVNMIITEMGVMDVTPEGLVLKEINPEFTVEQVQEATEAKLIIAKDLKPMAQ